MKFYDQMAQTYDYFIDWPERIKREDPFYQHLFQECLGKSIIDLGCGTGGHALHWGGMGYNVVGIDSSSKMIQYARELAEKEDVDIEFQCMKITDFASRFQQKFDAVVCSGNTLSHLLDKPSVMRLFMESIAVMKITGAAIYHILNYQLILENRRRDFPVKSRIVDGTEYVFARFYDFQNEHLEFNMVSAVKDENGWHSRSSQLLHHPWMAEELIEMAKEAGFTEVMTYGGYDFSEFNPETSQDLLLVCELGEA